MSSHISIPSPITFGIDTPTSVLLSWGSVPGAISYEVTGGGTTKIRSVNGTSTIIRGLRPTRFVEVRVRAVGEESVSDWGRIDVRTSESPEIAPDAVALIPIINTDRQSVQLRLPDYEGNVVDCLVRLWWQTSDESWWMSLEKPVNTPVVSSRRLGVNCGLLDHAEGELAGNIVMRPTAQGSEVEPTRQSIFNGIHEIRWEPRDAS